MPVVLNVVSNFIAMLAKIADFDALSQTKFAAPNFTPAKTSKGIVRCNPPAALSIPNRLKHKKSIYVQGENIS
jgi:hypothetical protein